MSTNINLLPQKNLSSFSQEKILSLSKVTAISSLIVTVSLAIVVFLLNRDQTLVALTAQQNTLLTQLNALHTKTAKDLIILDRLNRIKTIIKSRGNLDTTIQTLNTQLPSSLGVNNFSVNKKTFTFTISATSLGVLGQVVENFTTLVKKKDTIAQITIENVITDEKAGKYTMTMSGILL